MPQQSSRQRSTLSALVLGLCACLAVAGCQQTGTQAPAVQHVPPSVRPELAGLSNPVAAFDTELWSGMKSAPRVGDLLSLGLRSDADGFVSLFAVTSSGGTGLLIDNRRVAAGERVVYPAAADGIDIKLTPPAGVESFVVVASRAPLAVLQPGDIRRAGAVSPLALTSAELADRVRTATAQRPVSDWNAAVIDIVSSY